MEFKQIDNSICASEGFTASGIHCGIRKNKSKKDLALIYSEIPCNVANVYTQNIVIGAPLVVTKENCKDGKAQAIICNSGNANTCNADGEEKAYKMCELISEQLKLSPKEIVVASTGVIGQTLDISPIAENVELLVSKLSKNGSLDAAEAIMTTDTKVKEIAYEFELDGKICHIGGIAKGSGMIHPNMATMLIFITTDVAISQVMLQKALSNDVVDTFNMISVDGDTSTNDMVSILANGKAGNKLIDCENESYKIFTQALNLVTKDLSIKVAGDGEGATKLIECNVSGAKTKADAKILAKSVITSSLFKAAMFGSDANWGRILCAMGYSSAEFDTNNVTVEFASTKGTLKVCEFGKGIEFSEDVAKIVLGENKVVINITLTDSNKADETFNATAWGCDLTYDYVKINGDYRT